MLHMHTYMHNKSKKLYVVSVRADRKGKTQAEAVLALTIPAPVHAHKPSPPSVTSGVILPSWNISTTLISSKALW